MSRFICCCMLVLLATIASAVPPSPTPIKTVHIGVLEGGEYVPHAALREAYRTELEGLAPADVHIEFAASLFKSAGWSREKCKKMAAELAQSPDIDIVLAIGPWVVEDLREVGFTKPIVAMYQAAPDIEGLVDSTGRPTLPNLTITYSPDKIAKDLTAFSKLAKFKKLGVLLFPSGDEGPKVLAEINAIGKKLGFEAVTAEGFNNVGTYAFLKAYSALDKSVDAVYLFPLWDVDGDKARDFADRLMTDRRPSMTAESRYPVERGVFMSATAPSFIAIGRFNAWKTLRIIQGAAPADLPTRLPDEQILTINEKTARQLSIDIPMELRAQAEMVTSAEPSEMPLSINEAIQRAVDQNPGYLAKYDAMSQAASRASETWSALLPRLTAQAGAEYASDNTLNNESAVVNDTAILKNSRYGARLSLDQQVFSPQTIRAIQVAGAEKRLDEIDIDRAARDLELAVSLAFINYFRAAELDDVYRRQRQLTDHSTEVARAREATGESPTLDLNRWRAERLIQTNHLLTSQANLAAARVLLNALMNRPGNMSLSIDTSTISTQWFWSAFVTLRPLVATQSALQATQEKLVATALQQNPSMQYSRTEVDVQKRRLTKAWAGWLPSVGFRAALDFADNYNDAPAGFVEPGFVEKNPSWSLSARISWPLFEGGKGTKERRAARSRLSELEFLRDNVSLGVMQQIMDLSQQVAALGARAASADRQYDLAKQQITGSLRLYSSGKVSYLEVLDAAQLAQDVQEELINSKLGYFETLAELTHQLGWSPFKENITPAALLSARLIPAAEGQK